MNAAAGVRVGVVGLGPVGLAVAHALAEGHRAGLVLAGAADRSPLLAGHALSTLVPGVASELVVDDGVAALLARGVAVAILCTGSRIADVAPDIERLAGASVAVVTSCEELAAPPDDATTRLLDEVARRAGVGVLATGVNPGFVMDRWPLQLAALCLVVRGVLVKRVVDAALRREPLRRKVGHGLDAREFRSGVEAGRLGHVGLRASATLIARGLGTSLASAEESVQPVLGPDGRVLGVHQRLVATTADGRPIELDLQMSVGAHDPHDRVILDSDPPVDARIAGGLHGDRATVGALLEGAWRLATRPTPGLLTVADVY